MYPIFFGKYIIILDDSGNLFWVDKEFGEMRHKYVMEEFPVGYPILKDNIIYFVGRRGNFYAIHLSDATTAWKDLALIGDVFKMYPDKRGIILQGNQSHWLFNYTNGNKQDKMDFK
ncbi:MAG TPA: hypothetical protein PK079_11210 [Leptospiraceae bacterium]|nr:hypothetical protein [Leptospiraceae bacterium]HMW03434.1 hypothetical protein [Leptospiraceae bacterium]HMX31567.1 hypothetical protein [Leptospiraceae bacterium]HMY29646.1 hypothetical protein [Leptospiraceae bacterium]HMZ66567.1 hypothetical protein [Leptospiraceae bacterium]